MCGLIAHYNDTQLPDGPNQVPLLLRAILSHRLTVRGFLSGDFADQQATFLNDMSRWVREKRIKYREDIAEGLENAPKAFLKLFRGENFGKLLVRVADPGANRLNLARSFVRAEPALDKGALVRIKLK